MVRALLFYQRRTEATRLIRQPVSISETIVMDHHIGNDGTILAGTPVDTDKLIHDVFAVTHSLEREPWHFPDPREIAFHPAARVWFRPPGRRAMFVQTGVKEVDALDRVEVMHPGLVFVAPAADSKRDWLRVFATLGSQRPGAEDTLYCPPYMNCYGRTGSVCLGGVAGGLNNETGAPPRDSIDYWEWRWWESTFCHGEPDLADGWNYARLAAELTKHPDSFPYEALKEAGKLRLRVVGNADAYAY